MIEREVKITLSAYELAQEFSFMHDDQQALFLVLVSRNMFNWGAHDFNVQISGIADNIKNNTNTKECAFIDTLCTFMHDE